MKAEPVRIPEVWSPSWFRRFYNEVLARSAQPVGAIVFADTNPRTLYGYGDWDALGTGDVTGVTVTMYKRIG